MLIHKNLTTSITHEVCLPDCVSTQANILHAKGKDGENKQSKAACTDRNQTEHMQSFLYPVTNEVCTSVQLTLPAFQTLAPQFNISSCWDTS